MEADTDRQWHSKQTEDLYTNLVRQLLAAKKNPHAALSIPEVLFRDSVTRLYSQKAIDNNAYRIRTAMEMRIWAAALDEYYTFDTDPTMGDILDVCRYLDDLWHNAQRDGVLDDKLQNNLAYWITTFGEVAYRTGGKQNLWQLMKQSSGESRLLEINCIDLCFFANAVYEWMGFSVYFVVNDEHAWLQDRPPPPPTQSYQAALETLRETRFYDVSKPKEWTGYDRWIWGDLTGHLSSVYEDLGVAMYFLSRKLLRGRVPHQTLPELTRHVQRLVTMFRFFEFQRNAGTLRIKNENWAVSCHYVAYIVSLFITLPEFSPLERSNFRQLAFHALPFCDYGAECREGRERYINDKKSLRADGYTGVEFARDLQALYVYEDSHGGIVGFCKLVHLVKHSPIDLLRRCLDRGNGVPLSTNAMRTLLATVWIYARNALMYVRLDTDYHVKRFYVLAEKIRVLFRDLQDPVRATYVANIALVFTQALRTYYTHTVRVVIDGADDENDDDDIGGPAKDCYDLKPEYKRIAPCTDPKATLIQWPDPPYEEEVVERAAVEEPIPMDSSSDDDDADSDEDYTQGKRRRGMKRRLGTHAREQPITS